ncbi:GNAT family N-acetyltransferase [Nocardioides sp. ChNu-153]|nr:GNAT family N-acetyltransferase [Nocardioides sp. ChNu-153]MDN7120040.1 GNAT family N-acetyltransferase [Nocardioides sp. ChNu-153]
MADAAPVAPAPAVPAPGALAVRLVGPEEAARVHAVVRAAFAARPALDPPADALAETPASLAVALRPAGGMLAETTGPDGVGEAVGALLLDPDPARGLVWVRRFGVLPGWQAHGVGSRMVEAVVAHAGDRTLAVLARPELPRSVAFWEAHGFVESGRPAPYVELVRPAGGAR